MSVLAFAVMLLPGLAWWAWLGKRGRDPLEAIAQIAGISMAVILLLAEGVFMLGGSFSTLGLVLLIALFTGLAITGLVKRGVHFPRKYRWHLLVGLILLGLTFALRLYQASDLLLPNWVDSQHHYLIVKAILEQGGLPETLAPYLDMPLYYHYGFHALAALFSALSGLEIGPAMLIFGQALNALVSLSVYALGKTLWKDWRPAGAAALLVSFATRMPAYYLSWGRYTLITGLVLLPLAMAAALRLLRKPRRKADVAALGLLTAGVLLSHYFTAVVLALFLMILGVVHYLPRLRKSLTATMQFSGVITGTLGGLLLAAPWLLRVARYSPSSAGVQSNLPDSLDTLLQAPDTAGYIWQLLGPASNHWLLLTAGIGVVAALACRKQVAFGVWTLLLALLTLPGSFSLKPFRPDHFAIILFLPVTLWAGWLFWRLGCLAAKWLRRRWVSAVLAVLLVAVWAAWGFPLSTDIVNSVTVLVTEDDLDALSWVRRNTPEDARFFINTTYWQNNTYRGVDGGGWLLPYAGRWALVPTIFYGFSPDLEHTRELSSLGEAASEIDACTTAFWDLIDSEDIQWLYLHEGKGLLQPSSLTNCENLEIAYKNDRVWIFRIADIQ